MDKQYLASARRWGAGALVKYFIVKAIEGVPENIEVKKLERNKVNFGGIWYSDSACLKCPAIVSMPLACAISLYGGDKFSANMYLAHDALSEGLALVLDGLKRVNCSSKAAVRRTRKDCRDPTLVRS